MPSTKLDRALRIARARRMAGDGSGRRLRETARLTYAEVALVVGVTGSAVAQWERGETSPRGVAAEKYFILLEALERDLSMPAGGAA